MSSKGLGLADEKPTGGMSLGTSTVSMGFSKTLAVMGQLVPGSLHALGWSKPRGSFWPKIVANAVSVAVLVLLSCEYIISIRKKKLKK